MADYYDSPTDVAPVTRARSSDLNTLDAAVASAFAKVPAETALKEGVVNYSPDTGTPNVFVATLPYPPASYTDGLEVCLKAANANSGACTLNVNGLGAKSIKNPDSSVPSAGAIAAAGFAILRYNADFGWFVLMNPANMVQNGTSAYATLSGVEILSNKTLASPTIQSPTFTGTIAFPTQSFGDNSTKPATTAYVDGSLAFSAPLASPTFTGSPRAPTQAANDNSTKLATTAYVDTGLALKANAASPVFTGTVTDAAGDMRTAPQNVQNTGYALVLGDKGKHLIKTDGTARAHTVPPNSSVAFPLGTLITFVNLGGTANNLTITRGAGVHIYRAGTDADIAVTPGDMVTLLKVGTDTWQA